MLAASGVRIQLVFLVVFGFGAGLAGMAGIIGGTFQSLSPGEDTRFLLASLVVVIVGGMGSIVGAAIGALIIGVTEQMGFVYAPTYSVVFTFLIMAAVLAFPPAGPSRFEALTMAMTDHAPRFVNRTDQKYWFERIPAPWWALAVVLVFLPWSRTISGSSR